MEYTEEQKQEIINRVNQALVFIKGLDLELQAQVAVEKVNADNVFGFKVIPFLVDIKYNKTPNTTETTPKVTDVEATPKEEPTISPFISQPSTDENNTDSKTA